MAYPLFLIKLLIRSGLARFVPGVNWLTDGGTDFLRYYADPVLTATQADLQEAGRFLQSPPPDVIDLTSGQTRIESGSLNPPRGGADRRGWPPPWGLPELRSAVAEKMLVEQQLAFNPVEEVLITSGAAGALQTVLDGLVNKGDRVVLFDPSSPLFALALRTRRLQARWLYSWNDEGRLRFKLHELDRALRGARLMILSSPSNPTGAFLAPEDMEQLVWWAEKRDVLLVNDESFARFRFEGEGPSLATLARARNRTLTIGSVSKSHGLTALRVGWLAGQRHLMRACRISAALRMTLVPTVCQQLALAALRQPTETATACLEELASRRRYAHERLVALGLRAARPAGGVFLWLPVWEHDFSGREFTQELLQEKQVQVTPGDLFGPSGAGYVRVSFAGDDGRLREGLARIADFLQPASFVAQQKAA